MKYVVIFIVLTTFFLQKNYAQLQADNWVFRGGTYVSFNGAYNPSNVNFTHPTGHSSGGTSSYSDFNGNLLFTIIGSKVYDKNFIIFPSLTNGNELKGIPESDINLFYSSQPNLIIPYPNKDSLYIIFHINSNFQNNYSSSLYYSSRQSLQNTRPASRVSCLYFARTLRNCRRIILHLYYVNKKKHYR